MPSWDDYQEEVAQFFRGLGLHAESNVTVEGVRTSHDIDVVVRSVHVGFDLLWLVECKHWQRRVSKLHVLALREIVADLGADRGILMAEMGYQRGALEAAQLTNVQPTSLVELKENTSELIKMAELRALQDRLEECNRRYWHLDKRTRIKFGLRSEVAVASGYHATWVMNAIDFALDSAFRKPFPVVYDEVYASSANRYVDFPSADDRSGSSVVVSSANELVSLLNEKFEELERKLSAAEEGRRPVDDLSQEG